MITRISIGFGLLHTCLVFLQFFTPIQGGLELNDAVKLGSVSRVAVLLAQGASVTSRDSLGWTPLHNAANAGNVELTKLLLENQADIDLKDSYYGKTALHLASHNGQHRVVELLLEAGAAINITDINGQTPLHLAAWNGQKESVILLVKQGADINARDRYGSTPLRLAVIQHFDEIVKEILSFCPDLRLPDNKGVTVEQFAKKKGNQHILDIFEEHRRTPCSRYRLPNVARNLNLNFNGKDTKTDDTCPRREMKYPDVWVPYSWRMKETPAGELLKIPCPAGTSGTATWTCGHDGRWQKTPDLSECSSLFFSGWQEVMATDNVTAAEIITTIVSSLRDAEKGITLAPGDLITIEGILNKLHDKHKLDLNRTTSGIDAWKMAMKYLDGVIDCSDTMLTKTALWWGMNQKVKFDIFTKLQDSIKFATVTLAEHQMSSFKEFKGKMLSTRTMKRPMRYFKSVLLSFIHPYFNETFIRMPHNFYKTYREDQQETVRVTFVAYNNLHCTVNTVPCNPAEAVQKRDFPSLGQVNTPIIGGTLGEGSTWHAPLDEHVLIRFQHIYTGDEFKLGNRTCVWWDGNSNSWATDGCRLVETSDSYSLCQCNHLNNMAVIMDINDAITDRGALYQVIKCVMIVGCVVSVVSLTLCIICFLAFKDIRENTNSIIYVNLCLCLVISEMVLLGGIGANFNQLICTIIGATIHYFFLATFIWSAIEVFHLCFTHIKAIKSKISVVRYYMVIGYFIPLLYVGLTIGFAQSRRKRIDDICWLSTEGLVWSFVGPLAIILLFNAVVFVIMMLYSWCSGSQQMDNYNKSISSSSTKSSRSREKDSPFWQSLSLESQKHATSSSSSSSSQRMQSRHSVQGFPGSRNLKSSPEVTDNTQNTFATNIGKSLLVLALLCLTWASGFLYYLIGSSTFGLIFTLVNSMQGVVIFVLKIVMDQRVMREVQSVLK